MSLLLRSFTLGAFAVLLSFPLGGADQAQKRNYQACLRGLPECDRDMLTWVQMPSVKRADRKRARVARKRSFRACQGETNLYPCDVSILKPKQYVKVGGKDWRSYQRQPINPIAEQAPLPTLPHPQSSLTGGQVPHRATTAGKQPQTIRSPAPRAGCAENGSCYGDISSATGRPKTERVRGYYRKDGTYVRGHYRSRPR